MTNRVSKISKFAIAGVIALATQLGAATAEIEEVRVPTLSAPFGAGITEQAVIFERLIAKRHPWLRLVAQETPGFVYNIREMASNAKRYDTTAFWSSTGAIWAGHTAQEGFFDKAYPRDNFRWLVSRSTNCIWFTTTDPEIKSISDFSGKRLGVGRRSQTHWALFPEKAIRDGAGVNDAKFEYLGNNAGTAALLDGKADVSVGLATITADQSVVFPTGPIKKLVASERDFYNVPITKEQVEKVNETLDAPFVANKMKAGSIPGSDGELECMGDYIFLAVHKEFPDELAYEITKVYLDIDREAAKYLGAGELYQRENMCIVPKGIEAHPASLKACEDYGIEPEIMN